MTIDIKALAKQAGGTPYENSQYATVDFAFRANELAEFVRLVRESVLEECAKRSDAYAYMSQNFAALADEFRRMK